MLPARKPSTSKLQALILLCLDETALLVKTHQKCLSRAEADVADLLRTGQTQRALLWVERAIKEQNLLDVLFMVERILRILHERAQQIQTNKQCPNELREAVASLIYAAPRCGECPMLLRISKLLRDKFMKHSCTISPEANQEMMQLLSTKQPRLESRLAKMETIARLQGIMLNMNKISFSEF
ncbi:uncharacterized protein LOC109704748 [Ananas comosus]|uniref:Uncharacterized protein LOC109704748 n=1 Tax=Ananas comosus TaxID=4615 RepID=A0A6P5ECP3_ANACO|nr:uncharacterized protein LOC109704748 [Ananas comosus]